VKQTLLRILLTEWFGVEVREGIRYIGVGYLLIPWLILGTIEVRSALKNGISLKKQAGSLAIWGAVAGVIVALPLVASRFPVDSVPVFGWGFMLVLGFLSAGLYCIWRARKIGLHQDVIWDMGMHLFVSGIVGARSFYVIQHHDRVFKNAHGLGESIRAVLNLSDGGMVLFGGILLGIPAFIWFCRKRKLPPLLMADLIVPAVLIGVGFGRIGCLLNGCCYGDFCDLPWCIEFPQGSNPYLVQVDRGFLDKGAVRSLPLHPTQIYSSINAFVLAALTAVWFRYRSRDGDVLVLALLTYPVMRFTIEALRNDEAAEYFGMTISQTVSVGLFAFGLGLLAWLRTRPAGISPFPVAALRGDARKAAHSQST
jgi:phosphatidylglycerol:prolipoprotein diacylglycerol transferase